MTKPGNPHFIQYVPSVPPASSFYNDACNARAHGRAAIEELAMLLIEGQPPYEGQFLSLSGDVSPHYDFLISVHGVLVNLHEQDIHLMDENIKSLLADSKYETLGALLDDSDYRRAVDGVWHSYFSLVILSSYDQGLFKTLVQLLQINYLLGVICKKVDVTVPVTFEQLQELLKASIVLPAALFPLPPEVNG